MMHGTGTNPAGGHKSLGIFESRRKTARFGIKNLPSDP
jgi:hypothetical protein